MKTGLVGDVGGTNARFALATPERLLVQRTWPTRAVPSLSDVYADLARGRPEGSQPPDFACIAVAAPIHGPCVTLTNAAVTLDVRELSAGQARLVNDLEAAAAGIPDVPASERTCLVPGHGHPHRPTLVVGLGTGLGVAIRLADGSLLAGEGGHAAFAPGDPAMRELCSQFARVLERPVEWEDFLSGRGLGRVACWFRGDHKTALSEHTAALENAAATVSPHRDAAALDCVAGALADFLRGLALTIQAGSVVVCGGVAGHLRAALAQPVFAARFLAPGPVRPVLGQVPVTLITDEVLAFRGCLRLIQRPS